MIKCFDPAEDTSTKCERCGGNRWVAKRKFTMHRKACFAAIREANIADGLSDISDDELLAELGL